MKNRGKWSLSSSASSSSAAAASSFFFFSFFFVLFALSCGDQQRPAKCSLEVDEGSCSSQVLRWFFNRKTQHCETFVYSGCGGNENNFNSTMYCLHACNGTASNTHSYSAPSSSSSSSNSNGGKETSSGRKLAKRSRGSKLRSKRSDDVTSRVPKQRALPGDGGGESLRSALTHLTHSVNRLESIVRQNSRKISKLGPRKNQRRFALAPSSPEDNHHQHDHHQDTAPLQMAESQMEKTKETMERSSKTPNEKGIGKERGSSSSLEGDEDEGQRAVLDAKLNGLIGDPSFVFSCRNISSSDLSTLKEAVLEFDTEALREVTAAAAASDEERGGKAFPPPSSTASDSNSVQVNPVAEKQPTDDQSS